MAQETEAITEATEEVTTPSDLVESPDNLAPESAEQVDSEQPDLNHPEKQESVFDPEAEHEIEFGGKNYTVKGKDLQAVLENQQALAQREKDLNRDYTQKTQSLARERKSIETAFGRMPEAQEFQALGKLYQSYLADPKVAQVVDAIIQGVPLESILGQAQAQGKSSQNPEVTSLQREISALKGQLSQFVSTSEQKEQEASYNEGKRLFDTWKGSKESSGTKVPEEIIDAVLETASILRRRNPSWDTNKALDEALKRETVDQIQKTTTKQVFAKADNAKKMPGIKITPKAPAKSDANSGYAQIFQSAM